MTAGLIGLPVIAQAAVTKRLALVFPFSIGVAGSLAFANTDVSPTSLIPDRGSWSWLGASLLSPVIPQRSDLIDVSSLTGVAEWEAMNWLGLGAAVLVIGGFLKLAISRPFGGLSSSAKGLLFAVMALTTYSITVVMRLTPKHKVDFRDLHPFRLLTILGFGIAGLLVIAVIRRGRPVFGFSQRVIVAGRFVGVTSIFLLAVSRLLMGASGGRLSQSFVLVTGALVLVEISRFAVEPWRSAVLSLAGILWLVGIALFLFPGRLELITSTLRGSGRFMWPLVAVLVITSLVCLESIRFAFVVPICLVASLLQVSDTQSLRAGFSQNLMLGDGYAASSQQLQESLVGEIVHIRPALGCLNSGSGFLSFYNVVIAASRNESPVDPAVRSRAVKEDCSATPPVPNDAVIAIVEQSEVVIADLYLQPSDCDHVAGLLVCQT